MKVQVKLVNSNLTKFDELLLYYGLVKKKVEILNDFIEIPQKGFVYIYGTSGSGKSFTLNQVASYLEVKVKKFDIDRYNSSSVLLKDYINDLKLLARFGFSDIPVLLTPVNKLSDGQKYRLFLLEELSKSDILVLDEFCNCLDQFYTLSIIKTLYSFSKEKLIVVATSRPFGYEFFNIDYVYKISEGKIRRIYYNVKSLNSVIKIVKANKQDWKKFSRFHYRSESCGVFNKALKAVFDDEEIGIIIGGQPYLNISARNKIFPKYKNNGKLVNKEIFTIHRIVVLPEVRNLGIARILISELEKLYRDKVLAELMSSLATIIPFAEKAGFQYGGDLKDNPVRSLCKKLNFDFARYLDNNYVQWFVKKHKEKVFKAVVRSYQRGLSYVPKVIDEKLLVKNVQLLCNVSSKYYFKVLKEVSHVYS